MNTSRLTKAAVFLAMGLFPLSAALFAAIAIDLPQGRYGAAVMTLLVGAVMYVPPFICVAEILAPRRLRIKSSKTSLTTG